MAVMSMSTQEFGRLEAWSGLMLRGLSGLCLSVRGSTTLDPGGEFCTVQHEPSADNSALRPTFALHTTALQRALRLVLQTVFASASTRSRRYAR